MPGAGLQTKDTNVRLALVLAPYSGTRQIRSQPDILRQDLKIFHRTGYLRHVDSARNGTFSTYARPRSLFRAPCVWRVAQRQLQIHKLLKDRYLRAAVTRHGGPEKRRVTSTRLT